MPISVNVSEKGAAKKGPFEDLPLGWYHVQISDVELRESKSENNPGKPMYGFEFTVTEDPRNPVDDEGAPLYEGRRLWTNACLWEGAEFTIVNILRALGHEITPGVLEVPDITDPDEAEQLLGQHLMVLNGITKKERNLARKDKNHKAKVEITGFKSANEEGAEAPSGTAVPAVGRRRTLA